MYYILTFLQLVTQYKLQRNPNTIYIYIFMYIFIYVYVKRESYVSSYSGPLVTNWKITGQEISNCYSFPRWHIFFKNSSRILLTKEDSKKCDQCYANEILGLALIFVFFVFFKFYKLLWVKKLQNEFVSDLKACLEYSNR